MKQKKMSYDERMKWFNEARFGLFIHWGLYSLLGRGTWVMHHDRISVPQLERLARKFTGKKFDAGAWAALAVEAGMKYAVLTTRHHDGFCLFDSQASDFTSVKGAAKRDFVDEYVKAFRKAGLKVGFYYSLLDWRFPGYFEPSKYPESAEALVDQAHAQVRELLSNYGKIDVMWFDGHWFADILETMTRDPEALAKYWRSKQLEKMIFDLQPHIVINNRIGLAADYDTPEQRLPHEPPERPWELCETIGDYWQAWCHQRYTPKPILKSVGQLILELVVAARGCGNVLLNVGPKYDGSIPVEDAKRLRGVGEWLRIHGEAIYGSEFAPIPGNSVGEWTFKGDTGYMHLPCWPGTELTNCWINGKIKSARMLATGEKLNVDYDPAEGRMTLTGLPRTPPDPNVNVIKVQFDGKPKRKTYRNKAAWLFEE